MDKNLVATATTSVAAEMSEVWRALVTPDAIKQWMFGADVESDWEVGSPITWSGEFKGTTFEDKGEILQFDPPNTLSYSHFSPMSGNADNPENYHTVTIRLYEGDGTTTITLSQDNNPDEKARAESEKNWNAMLGTLKDYVESNSQVSR